MHRLLIIFGFLLGQVCHVSAQILQTAPEEVDTLRQPKTPPSPFFKQQKYLVLDKPGKVKRIRFFPGSEITFRLKNDPVVYHDYITAVDDSSFTIFGTKVLIKEVDRIILRNHSWFVNQGSVLLPAAGLIYFLADNVNPILRGQEGVSVSQGSIIVAGSLIGSGLVLRAFRKKQHRIGNNKRLRVLETF